MSIKDLPQATEQQTIDYVFKAGEFIMATGFYSSCKSVAVTAVAEYMAYIDGLTIRNWNES